MSTSSAVKSDRRGVLKKILVALVGVLMFQALFELCLVSAEQLSVPRNMPFGVVGSPSQVVAEVAPNGLALSSYPNESAAMTALEQGQLLSMVRTKSCPVVMRRPGRRTAEFQAGGQVISWWVRSVL